MKFMKEEAANGDPIIPLSNYKQRVLAATGISESSYKRILKEAESVDTGASTSFSSPRKNSPKTVLKTNLPNHEFGTTFYAVCERHCGRIHYCGQFAPQDFSKIMAFGDYSHLRRAIGAQTVIKAPKESSVVQIGKIAILDVII
ncbi:hypothetical protein RI129_004153 [Pyrocoelia pectoralis]|uniref:Uncharacterized protein n=1 Tax=Pyrocoelia pectoralis TaxID=417401 RepID=A0AAN7VKI8_9COLE